MNVSAPDWLPDRIEVNGTASEIFERLYRHYRLDFLDVPTYFRGLPVRCDSAKKPGEEYEEHFWHLVTRQDHAAGARLLDTRRAECFGWCAAIIANAEDNVVLAWDYREGRGQRRTYLWLRDWDYVVILERRRDVFWLITAFHVDERNRNSLQGKYGRRER